MCGFAGIFRGGGAGGEELEAAARRMIEPIEHRGPDDSGVWTEPEAGVALGFRRLAIIDLSEHGHQPMRSASGRFTLVFNGEVYNHRALRAELEGRGARFRGHSDTEVILAAFEAWGIEPAVRRFIGMFAIAAWDARARTLTLVRDRLGIKPLFVYSEPGLVTFGSELKALVAGPSFDRTLDPEALTSYLRHLYVPAPRTIYRRAIKLLPGHILTLRSAAAELPEPVAYWSVEEHAAAGLASPFPGSPAEALDELDRLLSDSVRLRLEADVPVGALLSGGIDSSLVVAMLQEISPRPVRTFAVAFDQAEHNEAHHAASVARHLGTDHTEVMLTGKDALDLVPRLAEIYDEPHADAGQIPTYLICGVARRQVTVALSGDGGDEVFAGYNRHAYGERMLQRTLRVPAPARRLVGAGLGSVSTGSWDRANRLVAPVLPRSLRQRLVGDKLHKLGTMMRARSAAGMYLSLVSVWQEPAALVAGASGAPDRVQQLLERGWPERLLDRMMLADQLAYLPDDQLAKVDRASMAVSLELRVPLLDHRVVEFSWRLPSDLKLRDGQSKWPLRQLLYRRVPREIIERPKMGFSVPLAQWLRGPLRPWAEELLSPHRLADGGVLRPAPIRRAWTELQGGRDHPALALWAVLMFQAWRERWVPARPPHDRP
jgi:asparagine synthase (glutamine-hydrolysing)